MAGYAAHAIFGREVLKEHFDVIPSRLIHKHRGVYGVGCQGPDLFFYQLLFSVGSQEKNLGLRMHHEGTNRYFSTLILTIREQKDDFAREVGLSYLYGALTHYTLDSIIHPYVYAHIGYDPTVPYARKSKLGLHHRLESAMDAKLLLAKESVLPSQYHAWADQRMSAKERNALAEILSAAIGKSYRIGLRKAPILSAFDMMHVISAGFFLGSDETRKRVQKIEWPFNKQYLLTNYMITDELAKKHGVMNTPNREWANPWDLSLTSNESVWELFDRATEKYRDYACHLKSVLPHVENGTFVYDDVVSEREMKQRVDKAVSFLGDLSYETGLPVSESTFY